ncbi:VOC family protein [Terriglobus aquaticus]|uniref:VOC family protein n=1 Tax=Terriglobus aquaticus TaxID=940139 RepID=A0ABW9KST0_9BACT|nr:VOC family protein [Terriglobus aquaticus]
MRSLVRLALFALAPALHTAMLSAQTAPQRPPITGIAFVEFAVSDEAAAEAFYGKELGFAKQTLPGSQQDTVYPVNRGQWIETASGPFHADAPSGRLLAVGLRTTSVPAMQAYLKAKGITPVGPVSAGRLAVHDPEGNTVVFVDRRTPTPKVPAHDNGVSHRIIHAGFVVGSGDKENTFYRDVLGFKPYWHGGMHDGVTDFISQQVPNGTDWIEFMLNVKPDASAEQRGVSNHFSLGVRKMDTAIAQFKANGCDTHNCTTSQMGRDGKVQLNVFDPDHSRVELMEYEPSGTVCCSPFVGKMPSENDPQ